MRSHKVFYIFILLAYLFAGSAAALEDPAQMKDEVGIDQNVGADLDLSLQFTDSSGNNVTLSQFFTEGRPVVIVPVYYSCPKLCGLIMNGLTQALNQLTLNLNRDFQVLAVSFDTSETPKLAAKRQQEYHSKLNKGDPAGWTFLVGDQSNVNALMTTIGFRVKPDGSSFAHAATIVILTPTGKIARYFPGIEFNARDLRLALVEASSGEIGSVVDAILLYCFQFDPTKGKYTWAVFGLLKVVGTVTIIAMGGLLWSLWSK